MSTPSPLYYLYTPPFLYISKKICLNEDCPVFSSEEGLLYIEEGLWGEYRII